MLIDEEDAEEAVTGEVSLPEVDEAGMEGDGLLEAKMSVTEDELVELSTLLEDPELGVDVTSVATEVTPEELEQEVLDVESETTSEVSVLLESEGLGVVVGDGVLAVTGEVRKDEAPDENTDEPPVV